MLNSICIQGRLVKDPEVRNTSTGKSFCSFMVACDRPFKDDGGNKATDFLPIVAWHSTAKFVGQYFKKGDMMIAQGRLQSRSYEDNNGKKQTVYEIVAEQINFAGGVTEKKPQPSVPDDDDPMPFDI